MPALMLVSMSEQSKFGTEPKGSQGSKRGQEATGEERGNKRERKTSFFAMEKNSWKKNHLV